MSSAQDSGIDRRTFLKIGSAAAAATVTGLGAARAEDAAKPAAVTPVYRTLGRTGMKVAIVGLGAFETADPAIFQAAFDRGVNFVDTARLYLNGRSEKLLSEGGYEAVSYHEYAWPAPFAHGVEGPVNQALLRLRASGID